MVNHVVPLHLLSLKRHQRVLVYSSFLSLLAPCGPGTNSHFLHTQMYAEMTFSCPQCTYQYRLAVGAGPREGAGGWPGRSLFWRGPPHPVTPLLRETTPGGKLHRVAKSDQVRAKRQGAVSGGCCARDNIVDRRPSLLLIANLFC